MAKMTLIEMVQDILSDMGGDEVNSIEDTFEAVQVAQVIKTTYLAMMSNRDWPHLNRATTLIASGDNNLPTHMTVPDDVKEIKSVLYDCAKLGAVRKDYKDIKYRTPEDFLRFIYQRNSSEGNVLTVVDPSGTELFILDDHAPQYFTSFDDNTIVFDSYDSAVDNTLQESKMVCTAQVMPQWSHIDTFTPDLPTDAFIALLEEAKSRSFVKVAQRADQTATIEARRQQSWLSRKAFRVAGGIQYPSYGRGKNKTMRDPTFRKDN